MKAFDDRTHHGQMRRLRRLAQAALLSTAWAAPGLPLSRTGRTWAIDQAQHNAGFRRELEDWLEWAMVYVQLYLGKKSPDAQAA